MAVAVLLYLAVGTALGWAWNRAEFGRVGFRRIAPSFCAFIVLWPGLVAYAIAIAALWTRIWRRAHDTDAPAAASRDRAAPLPPFAPSAAEPSHPV
jgi:hypothetical protein